MTTREFWPHHSIERVWADDNTRHYQGGFFGVTSVLSATKPREAIAAIERWRVGKTPEQLTAPARRGTDVHALIEKFLIGEYSISNLLNQDEIPDEIPECYRGYVESAKPWFRLIDKVYLVEGTVWNPRGYAGTVDHITRMNTLKSAYPYVGDTKTAERKRQIRHDSKVQLAAYTGGVNHVYETKLNRGKIVLLLPKADCLLYDICPEEMMELWGEWLRRLAVYKQMIADRDPQIQ